MQGAFLGGVVGSLNYTVMSKAAQAAGATDNPLYKSQMAVRKPFYFYENTSAPGILAPPAHTCGNRVKNSFHFLPNHAPFLFHPR